MQLKEDSNTGEICEIFKNTYFEEHLRTAALVGCFGNTPQSQEQRKLLRWRAL